jgi:hypothetical protein
MIGGYRICTVCNGTLKPGQYHGHEAGHEPPPSKRPSNSPHNVPKTDLYKIRSSLGLLNYVRRTLDELASTRTDTVEIRQLLAQALIFQNQAVNLLLSLTTTDAVRPSGK